MADLKTRILLRSDTLANWNSYNPKLSKGEVAVVYDPTVSESGRTIRIKIGDGVNAFNSLPYISDYDAQLANIVTALEGKISKTSETYNLPYYFDISYQGDKVVVTDYTVDLNTGDKRQYSIDILPATTTTAGIMTADDKAAINEITNKADKSYVDEKDAATLASAKTYTDEQIALLPKINYRVVDELPAPSEEYDFNKCRTIFLVKDPTAVGADVYNEFICVKNEENVYVWEKIGDTRIDLSAYRKAADQDVIDNAIKADITAEQSARITEDNKKTDKEIVGANGTAYIFNESDGGGAKFVNNDGTESFIGVNDGGANGIAAQIYADKLVDGKWQGAKLDVKNEGIYYTVGNKSAAERDIADNEIAVKKDITDAVSGKLNVLPNVDDPSDPGYDWPYHIPYRFDVALDAEKANIDLHTLTLDNKVTKMTFNKQVPAASTVTAGLMSAADKVSLEGKQDKFDIINGGSASDWAEK